MAGISERDRIETATMYVERALEALGLVQGSDDLEDAELDLGNTPGRVVRMWRELTAGLRKSPPRVAAFASKHKQMLCLRDLDFVSLCSHHLAPFRGKAFVAYLPAGKVMGISKPARVIDHFAAQPQTQERLTKQIADYIMEKLEPDGVMIVLQAEHTCISCRGARKPGSKFITSEVRGMFYDDPALKEEFLALLNIGS